MSLCILNLCCFRELFLRNTGKEVNGVEQTIAAVATAPGESGIGIIRISGPEAPEILKRVFEYKSGKKAEKFEERRMIYGNIVDEKGEIIDEAMVVYMKAPHTYTGEDVAEIQCHGSIVSLRKILSLVLSCGAQPAERGEFTKRAFLNGKIDLAQAEAVNDVIKAVSDEGSRSAVSQLGGSLSAVIISIRTQMADLLSEIIAHIEYPEEDLEELTYAQITEELAKISERIKRLADSADTGRIVRDGLKLCIAGRPNVGKSSLMNALLKTDRAIVTDIPGTTRDTIEEFASVAGIPVRLTDTAGIRETEDTIEKIGIQRSRDSIRSADIVIFVADGSQRLSEEDTEIISQLSGKNVIFVFNKSDLGIRVTRGEIEDLLREKNIDADCTFAEISALTGEGIDRIAEQIRDTVFRGKAAADNEILITNVRHADLLHQALRFLSDADSMLRSGEALDFAETDIRSAWSLLGEIIGETVNQDILTEVFSRFCLGK